MTSADVIVVGAGAAGTFAAYQLRERNVLMLDVGHRASPSRLNGNLYDVRKSPERRDVDLFSELIGAEFESLHNIFHPYLSPKLKAPRMRFVTAGADDLSPVTSDDRFAMSFAAGGMAHTRGAGRHPLTAAEVAAWPSTPSPTEPHDDAV